MNGNKSNCNCGVIYAGAYEELPEIVKYFQEICIAKFSKIPKEKPDIEMISSFTVQPYVESVRLINTPEALSFEGQNLSGYKLIIELAIPQRVKYVADERSQPVHSALYENEMKSVFVVVPEKINGVDIHDLIRTGQYSITPYILYKHTKFIDKRTFFKTVNILVDVVFCS